MSDGNFNRSLLPHTPYHSGLQAGKAMARMQSHRDLQMLFGNTASRLYRGRTKRTNGNLQKRCYRLNCNRKTCPIPLPHNTYLLVL